MYEELCFFVEWKKIKKQLNELPGTEQVIQSKLQVNDGITKAFVLYLASMW